MSYNVLGAFQHLSVFVKLYMHKSLSDWAEYLNILLHFDMIRSLLFQQLVAVDHHAYIVILIITLLQCTHAPLLWRVVIRAAKCTSILRFKSFGLNT